MILRWVLAGVLVLHGIAHIVGFVAPWRLVEMTEMPYRTTVLGGTVDLGDRGIRLVGVLWLIAAIAFIAAAVGLLSAGPWWLGLASFAAVLSLFLTVLEWPETRIGLLLDVVLLAVFLSQAAYDWLPGPA